MLFDAGVPESELQYGPQLRASLLKSKRRNDGVELQEEKRLLLAFWKGQDSTGARARLDFDIARHKLEAGEARAKGGSSFEHMHVDGEPVEVPSDAIKRKIGDINTLTYHEKVHVMSNNAVGTPDTTSPAEVAMQPRQLL